MGRSLLRLTLPLVLHQAPIKCWTNSESASRNGDRDFNMGPSAQYAVPPATMPNTTAISYIGHKCYCIVAISTCPCMITDSFTSEQVNLMKYQLAFLL